ncbi:TnpV protein [Clostridium sp. C1]|nr:TnpV protein [Clostridium sp. C1]
MKELTYNQVGDYLMPNLKAEEPILNSRFARMRYNYLKENYPAHLLTLRAKNKLNEHLKTVDQEATQRMEVLMEELLKKQPAPDKETHQMKWVQHMNNLKAQAEEIILAEIIYN